MIQDTAKPLDIQFQKRLLPNLITNIFYFILNLVVGLALIPYFVDSLGYAAYGLIPLATSITSYVTMIIDAVNIPVSRYLSISLQKGDHNQANVTYNTVLIGTLGIIIALIPVAVIVAWAAPYFFNIGDSAILDVFLLFLLVMGSVLIRAWGSNFMATLFAYNRLDFRNYVNIANTGLQIGIIVLLFTIITPSLVSVGSAYFLAAVFSLVLSIILSKKTAVYLRLKPSEYSGSLFREIIGVSLWSLLDKFGGILNGTIALLVANRVLGEVLASDYSVSLSVYTGLIAVGGLVTSLFAPKVYSYISANDMTGLLSFCKSAIKCSGLVIALPIAGICLYIPEILTIWMGAEYTYLTPLVWIVILPSLFWIAVSPIGSFGIGLLKVRGPAFSALFTGCLNVVLSILLPTVFNMGVYGIALASFIAVWLHAGVICPIYYAYVTKIPWYTYTLQIHKTLVYLAAILLLGGVVITFIQPSSILMVILGAIVISLLYIFLFPRLFLTKSEKRLVLDCVPKFVPKRLVRWIL